jgi:hypothetical protein
VATDTKFSVFGSGGWTIQQDFAAVGPQFVLTRRTKITEIGGFVNNCAAINAGVPVCPDTKPVIVQIHPDDNGAPDPDVVLATIELTHDNDPLVVSFESASTHLMLPAGTYYALFTTQQPQDQASLLIGASVPFDFRAELSPIGLVSSSQAPSTSEQFAAVRIIAAPS